MSLGTEAREAVGKVGASSNEKTQLLADSRVGLVRMGCLRARSLWRFEDFATKAIE